MNSNFKGWMGRVRMSLMLAAIVLLVATGQRAMAQAVYGQIQGTVTDSTGAAVPGATIVVTDTAKGTSVSLTSNGEGLFTVAHLIPDTYNVKVSAPGFKGYETKGLQIFADSSQELKAVLAVGASDQVVQVNADTQPQLKTDRADVATTYTAQELTELPIPDHNFTNLQLLLPGAVQLGWAHAASENPQGSKQIQIDGQAFGGVNYTLDGTDNEDAILGIIVVNPNSESMSEAKISTQNFDAEFGKAVASVVSIQTKSGTNAFHGTLFDNRESNANLARDPFSGYNAATGKDIPYGTGIKNQFGGSIGGPIWKDKIFFFGDYQGVRQKSSGTGIGTVPTLRALKSCTGAAGYTGCDFSDYLSANAEGNHQIYNAACTGAGGLCTGNILPLSALSPQAVNLFKLLLANGKTPNSVGVNGAGLRNNYVGNGTGAFNSNQWDIRGDATINQKIHVFGRFSRFTDILSGASLFGPAGGPGLGIAGYGGVSHGANDSLALGTDIAITSKLVTDVRLGYFRYNIGTTKNDPGNTNLPFLGENVSGTGPSLTITTDYGTPDIQIADTNQTNLSTGVSTTQNQGPQFGSGLNMNHCNCPLKEKEDQFQIVNNWTKTIGNHAVKFGADLRYARNLRVPSDSDRTGVNNFANGPTSNGTVGGLGFATFILGDVTAFNRYASTSTNAKEFQIRDYFYAQDTWRASPKLTINAGLRYEFYGPERVNGAGNGALLNLSTGYINVAGENGVPLNMGVGAAKNAYNPRVGVAYQWNDKTVIRAGYGRSFDLGVFGSTFGHVVTQNIPVLANQSLNGTGGNTSYAFNLSNPGVAGNGATSPLADYTPPAVNANGKISITTIVPGTGQTIGQFASVKARPFTERLPTLDAWNAAVQRSLTPTLSVEVAYVGNKGTHTLSDGDGNNTNPNESAITLPANFSATGYALHYDPAGGNCIINSLIPAAQCGTGGIPITANGATSNQTLLQRYVGGSLPACVGSVYGGACAWTQGISYYGDDQDTHYNALQVKVNKSYTKGLSVALNYAYQVGTDNASNFATWNKQAIIGNDSAIRRSAFTGSGLYKLPFGKNQMFLNNGGLVNYIVGGWEISPIVAWQSGLPFSLSYDSCGASIPGDAPCQPNGSAGSLKTGLSGFGTSAKYFTPPGLGGAFTAPGLDTIGNIKRNTAWGPRFFNADLSVSKAVTFHERYEAKFRMDAYNVVNHINYGNPSGSVQSGGGIGSGPYPASLSGTTNPRQLQFTVHLQF
jgi:outer membrane receptor protein involved in Fe transport